MFGYVKPYVSELKVKEHELYKAIYCGLCRTHRKKTGKLSCLTLSYDFVFLYLLRSEILKVPTSFEKMKHRCLHKKHAMAATLNDELTYCAAVSVLLSYYKLKDNVEDESFFQGFSSRMALPFAKSALKKARKAASIPEKEVEEILSTLSKMEKEGGRTPDEYASVSGKLVSTVASYNVENPISEIALEEIGLKCGKWLYLMDAVDDYENDKKKKRFNPFLLSGEELRKEDMLFALDAEADRADEILSKIPIYDIGYRALLSNILLYGMSEEAKAVIYKEKQSKGSENQ